MAGSERARAEDRMRGPARGGPDQHPTSALAVSGLLALQRSAGNAAVGRLLAGRGPVAQRAGAEMTSAILEARAQERIEKAQAERVRAGGEGKQPEARRAPPDPAAVAAEKARQRRAIAGTVSPPDTSSQQSAASSAAAEVKAAVQAPATPVAGGGAAAPPPAPAGGASGPAAAAQE